MKIRDTVVPPYHFDDLYHTAQVFTAVQLRPALSRCDTWPLTLSLHGSLWEIMLNISTRNLCTFFFFFFFFFFFLTWSSRGSWSASGTCIGWFYALLMLPTLEVEWTVSEWVCEDEISSRLCWTSCLDPETRTWLKYLLLELGFISK